ncbi:acyl-CoA dehydrogenase NM domain-like protein [Auriscalpium vulgare]|uniref:Acyl-CoA dehydrogenase NM domain-like protein n=1 Tax=Auriscalpium vulgare TaxID=40419 RepID=A0ACB8RSB0_9AGAM|nr:acyl-CoA dehydrogenase NM domain-like protein [Auriscalpium vulgare]
MGSTSLLPTHQLRDSQIFRARMHDASPQENAKRSYDRAKAIGLAYNMTAEDVRTLSPKFWDVHRDPLLAMDGACVTLLTIQYNLVVGTLSHHLHERADLASLVDDLLTYRKIGQFLLTELGHGLDAENIETVAQWMPDADAFLLHTPDPQAAKFMPPTVPMGTPCVGIVLARLVVENEFRGIRPFIVELNDGMRMCPGITAQRLPYREGTNPVNHALTSFSHVRLPRAALLGSLDAPPSLRDAFRTSIARTAVGTLAVSLWACSALDVYAALGLRYSLRRMALGAPIWRFRTQQAPVLAAIAYAHVLDALLHWATDVYADARVDVRVRNAVAACAKAVTVQHAQPAARGVAERCGALGLFAVNQMSVLHDETRGVAISEGDILGLSIRLATELLLGRYSLPAPADPTSLLALHEAGLLATLRERLARLPHHRAPGFNTHILPHCRALVEAAGHRLAYDAARARGVPAPLVQLYVARALRHDAAWYAECAGLGTEAQDAMERDAQDAVLRRVDEFVGALPGPPFVTAPIAGEAAWEVFVAGLELFGESSVGRGVREAVRAQL